MKWMRGSLPSHHPTFSSQHSLLCHWYRSTMLCLLCAFEKTNTCKPYIIGHYLVLCCFDTKIHNVHLPQNICTLTSPSHSVSSCMSGKKSIIAYISIAKIQLLKKLKVFRWKLSNLLSAENWKFFHVLRFMWLSLVQLIVIAYIHTYWRMTQNENRTNADCIGLIFNTEIRKPESDKEEHI